MPPKQTTPPGKTAVDPEENKSQYDYDFADGWKPEEGDVLEGVIMSIDTGTNEYGTYPIVTIQQADGTSQAAHAFHAALRSQLARVRPTLGQKIGIKYLGKQAAKNPTPGRSDYANYRVIVPEGLGGYNWDAEEGAIPLRDDQPNF